MIHKTIFLTIAVCFALVYTYDDVSELTFLQDLSGYTHKASRDTECTQIGFMCENCTTIAYCFLVNGNFSKDIIGTCSGSTTCKDGECTSEPEDECNTAITEHQFHCHQPGQYPDPYDCRYFHLCFLDNAGVVVDKSTKYMCPEGYGYDVSRGVCRTVLTGNKCAKHLIEPCRGLGSGPIPGNPNLFFICQQATVNGKLVYQPQIFACEKNYEFYNNSCRVPHPVGIEGGLCTRIGNFYYPNDCRKYYECTTSAGVPVVKSCSMDNNFNAKTEKCELFKCPN